MLRQLRAWVTSAMCCAWLVSAASAYAGAAPSHLKTPKVHGKKKKKPQDKCDAIGKPCTDGDDCKPDNCKPGGEAPAPQRA